MIGYNQRRRARTLGAIVTSNGAVRCGSPAGSGGPLALHTSRMPLPQRLHVPVLPPLPMKGENP